MGEPVVPLPLPLGYPENNVIFCTACGIHLALTSQPLCPVCVDQRRKEEKR